MQELPTQKGPNSRDYQAGFTRIMRLSELAKQRGWYLSNRQLVHEILHRERAALIREKSLLPIIGQEVRSADWNRGEADALRAILRQQRMQQDV